MTPASRSAGLALPLVLLLAGACSAPPGPAPEAAPSPAAAPARPTPEGPSPASPSPPARRVVFVGVDGATWKVIGPMLSRGELPAFARLVGEGAHAPRFETIETTKSPVVWASVITGRKPADHGILDFVETQPDGRRLPVSSSSRRAKALWEVATEHDVSAGVIGWWGSWPAEHVMGYVVTDHANPVYVGYLKSEGSFLRIDPGSLFQSASDFQPAELAPLVARHWIDLETYPIDDLVEVGRLTPAQTELLREAPFHVRNHYGMLKTFYAYDRSFFEIGRELAGAYPVALQVFYFRGADTVQHYAWDLVEPEAFPSPPPWLERDRGLVEATYRYLDGFLGEILDDLAGRGWLVVASDHGFEATPHAATDHLKVRPGEHSRAAKGVLFVHGPGVRPGLELDGVGPYDIFPTLAWLLGLPLSDELEGRPLTEAFGDDVARELPIRRVPTYGPREATPSQPSAADEAMLESLRALGYIH